MRCLVIKTSAFGDIVQAFPIARYLKRMRPELTLTWVVERRCAELIERHPLIDFPLIIDTKQGGIKALFQAMRLLRKQECDYLLDLQGNIKSALMAACIRSPCKVGFARGYVAEWPNTWATHRHILPSPGEPIGEDYLALAQGAFGIPIEASDRAPIRLRTMEDEEVENHRILERAPPSTLLLFPSSAWPNKVLSRETLMRFLIRTERELGLHWLIGWGSEQERECAVELSQQLQRSAPLPKLSIARLQHLMTLTAGCFCCDSLPLHLASAAGVPTYSCFGPSSSAKYGPVGELHGHIQGSCPYGYSFEKRCPHLRSCSSASCIKELSAEQLHREFAQWLTTIRELKR